MHMTTTSSLRGLTASFLFVLLSSGAFRTQAQVVQINTGTPNTPLYAVGPIYMSTTLFYRYSRFAYLYTQQELAAAGIIPGTTITSAGWMKSTTGTAAGPATFSIYMKNSSTAAYANATESWSVLSAGSVQVYTQSTQTIPATANSYIEFPFTTAFTYTGGSLEVLTEWDISAAATPIATGAFEWVNTTVVDRIYASGNTTMPTTLSSTSNNTGMDDRRPVVQFTVELPSSIQETMAERIALWPNPAEHFVNISNGTGEPLERIEVIDALGRVVLVDNAARTTTDHRINTDQLPAGQYLLGIQTPAGRVVKRVTLR